jgi:hypothetical protein
MSQSSSSKQTDHEVNRLTNRQRLARGHDPNGLECKCPLHLCRQRCPHRVEACALEIKR